MEKIARLFKNGTSQAVRLPVQFEFDTDQVYVRKTDSGDVILSKKSHHTDDWSDFFLLLNNVFVPDDFLSEEDRGQKAADRDPFAGFE